MKGRLLDAQCWLEELIELIDRTVFSIRNPHSEIRNRETGHWMLDTGYSMLVSGLSLVTQQST
jgi:hypothetical protein